jgi:hypothetical protein
MQTARRKATESPWFLGDGQNLLVREVRALDLLLLALLKMDHGQTNRAPATSLERAAG